ncbi:hypothetical protein WR25_22315 [Diploscapter pachys]|uniref:Protein kinase domain-containing protein n=1 Tax=Diploscapter pachys TaxID=2018661 RepID=A0A2A2L144_9BILA|nr:hypothetical protein WR25_22315 [Diploscapter pachys]
MNRLNVDEPMERGNSLSLTDLDEDDGRSQDGNEGRGMLTPKNKKTLRNLYRGRYSTGMYSKSGEKLVKLQRKKSRQDMELKNALRRGEFDEGFSSQASSSSSSQYRCLRGLEKDRHSAQNATETTTSSASSTEQQHSPIIGSRRPTMSTSISSEPTPFSPHTKSDDRTHLFHDITSFMTASADRHAKCSKLIPVRTVDTRHGHHKYEFAGILWIVLRSYFSGRNVTKGQDASLAEDNRLFQKRAERSVVLDQLDSFQLPALELDIRQLDSKHFESQYIKHLCDSHKQGSYLSQFQNWKDLRETVAKERGAEFVRRIEDRVAVLTAWINTVDDLNEKIALLGELFEVSSMENSDYLWPRPLSTNNKIKRVLDARPVFEAYVRKSMNLKGMRKVLQRVSKITELSILKAAILLQRSPSTYAQAATARRSGLQLTDQMKQRYSEMIPYGFNQPLATSMRLPLIEPFFYFLIMVPVELVRQWLKIRTSTDPEVGCELDALTLSTMIEDSRDCLEEAVYVKKRFVRMLRSMCPCTVPSRLYPERYVADVSNVFRPCRLFTKLEREWSSAIVCARVIHSALETLSKSVSDLIPDLLRVWVTDYWETKLNSISVNLSAQLESEKKSLRRMSESSGGQSFSTTFSEANRVIRDVKERGARIFAHMRIAVTEMTDATGYEMTESWEHVMAKLQEHHWMVEIGQDDNMPNSLPVSIFVDQSTVDQSFVEQSLIALFEKSKKLENDGHIILIPNELITTKWKYRSTKITLDKVKRSAFEDLRHDIVCVIGNYSLSNQHPNLFVRCAPSCSSSESIDENFKELTGSLLSHLDKFWELFLKSWDLLELLNVNHTKRENICSSLEQIFTFAFQLHRDACRYVCEAYKGLYGKEIVEKCARVIFKWKELIELKQVQPWWHIPIWAQNAFNFMQYLSDPKWTNVMDDQLFKDFSMCVKECTNMVVIPEDGKVNHLSPQSVSKRFSSNESKSTIGQEESSKSKSRRELLAAAAKEIDSMVEKKNRECFPMLGWIQNDDKKEKFTLEQYANASRPAPFQWNLLEVLASGTFGVVYKGYNVQDQRVIAVKKMKVHRDAVKMIEGEVDIFRTLDHPNLVKYYGVEVHQDEVSILMEYCSEGTLERICGEGMDLSLARRYTNHLLKAVDYLHDKHVIHRDIKPANIFLDLQNVLKLGDFGCSIRLRDSSTIFGEFREFVGTPQYMAPEVFDYGDQREDGTYRGYGRAVDIWSIGCVVIEMLTGRPPWPKLSKMQIAWKLCSENKPPPYPQMAKTRQDLKRFLDMCLARDPAKRAGPKALLHTPFANVHIDTESTFEALGFEKITLNELQG